MIGEVKPRKNQKRKEKKKKAEGKRKHGHVNPWGHANQQTSHGFAHSRRITSNHCDFGGPAR
jgi:hypothetical protein